MKKPGRNDPCPCGSGKKYKRCCLKAKEDKIRNDRSETVPKAFQWLLKHGKAVDEAIDQGFFGSLDDEEYHLLSEVDEATHECMMINAMEWLLADGFITIKGQEYRVADLLLGLGGPLFSVEQRQWIVDLTNTPLRLYEIIDVKQGEWMTLRDVIQPDDQPVRVQEKSGSQHANQYDLIAARILPVDDHFELSGAVYAFPRLRSEDLIKQLKIELEGIKFDLPLAKEITSIIIPSYWLQLFISAVEIPQMIDQVTGESILFVTDHYRVLDWDALINALSAEADIEGNRDEGWSRVFEGEDGQTRRSLYIDSGKRSDRIKAIYRTQQYADQGKQWLETVTGESIELITREVSDPKGMLSQMQPNEIEETSNSMPLPPEVMTELFESRIRQLYANWVDENLQILNDRTPREAIQTPEGLEQVKFLLHTYENSEAQQAKIQKRAPVSYDFLWQSLGITP